jgi:hypothetical protein
METPAISPAAPIDDLLLTIASNLVMRTKQAGMDRLDLARLADLNRNTVGAALAGGDIKLSTLIRLTRALGYADWLLPLLSPPEPSPMEQLRASQRGHRRRKRPAAGTEAPQVPQKPPSRVLGRGLEGGGGKVAGEE